MIPRIVIASYNRPDLITSRTLAYLKSIHYPATHILIFVASEEQKALYQSSINPDLYSQIIIGILGLNQQRNFISKYLEDNEIYISFDDDVSKIKFLEGYSFYSFLAEALTYIKSGQVGLAGVLSNSDARKFKSGRTLHLAHIVGSFFVCKNHKETVLPEDFCEKEDYIRTIMYFIRYKAVLRCQYAGVETKYLLGVGGIPSDGRLEREIAGVEYLLEKYPSYCKRIVKKSGNPDILLNWRARA
jgi:hypothetical protein